MVRAEVVAGASCAMLVDNPAVHESSRTFLARIAWVSHLMWWSRNCVIPCLLVLEGSELSSSLRNNFKELECDVSRNLQYS